MFYIIYLLMSTFNITQNALLCILTDIYIYIYIYIYTFIIFRIYINILCFLFTLVTKNYLLQYLLKSHLLSPRLRIICRAFRCRPVRLVL